MECKTETSATSDLTCKLTEKDIDPVKTGNFIVKLRKSLHLTQDELGALIFISRKSVSKWETGRCCPSIDMLKKLSELLGVTTDELIAGEFIDLEEEPVIEDTKIEKVARSRWIRIGSLLCGIFVVFIVAIIINFSLNSDKFYLLNGENDYFSTSNGLITLSKTNSNIYIGDFVSLANDIDETTEFDIKLYHTEYSEENIIVSFNGHSSVVLDKDVSNYLRKLFAGRDKNNLYLRISYENLGGDLVTHDLKLSLLESNKKSNEMFLSDIKTASMDEQSNDENIDLSFLFETDSKVLSKKLNNKKIKVGKNEYKVSYEKSSLTIYFSDTNFRVMVSITDRKVFYNNIKTIKLDENFYISRSILSDDKFAVLKSLFKEISKLLSAS